MPASQPAPEIRLRKVLGLWDLIFYGMVLIQPTAPIPLFGVAQKLSNGHTVTTIVIAMFAMIITAVSYGRMAAVYPSAGSAYTYVGRTINLHLGFLVGWAMLLDYMLQPLLNVVWISAALHSRYLAEVPFPVMALIIAAFITALNLIGIRSSVRRGGSRHDGPGAQRRGDRGEGRRTELRTRRHRP
jgi:amino acid transporter